MRRLVQLCVFLNTEPHYFILQKLKQLLKNNQFRNIKDNNNFLSHPS